MRGSESPGAPHGEGAADQGDDAGLRNGCPRLSPMPLGVGAPKIPLPPKKGLPIAAGAPVPIGVTPAVFLRGRGWIGSSSSRRADGPKAMGGLEDRRLPDPDAG